jgi:phosphatidylglycerol:prolipoprotein diacylglycerol transferase
LHPVLFHLGSLAIHSYGVMLMLGFLAGIWLSSRQARKLGLPSDLPVDLSVWLLLSSVLLARLTYAALNWGDYASRPLDILQVWKEGGLSFHGGLLGGVLAVLLFSRRARISFWLLADMLSPGLALGYAIARVGCFLNGCCYGAPTCLPWGVVFPGLTTEPAHPTQLYASLGSLLICLLLLRLQSRLRAQGQLFLLYLMLYSVLRLIMEIFRRGASAQELFTGVTQAQAASLALFALAALGFPWLARRGVRYQKSGAP